MDIIREKKKTKNHVALACEGALELSGNGVLIPGVSPPVLPPPKIGAAVVVDGTFGLFIGGVVMGVFGPPAALNMIRHQIKCLTVRLHKVESTTTTYRHFFSCLMHAEIFIV